MLQKFQELVEWILKQDGKEGTDQTISYEIAGPAYEAVVNKDNSSQSQEIFEIVESAYGKVHTYIQKYIKLICPHFCRLE